MQTRNRAESHVADNLLDRRLAAWQNWKQLVVALVRLQLKRWCWSCLGVHLRAIKNRLNLLEPEGLLEISIDSSTADIHTWHQELDILQLGEGESTRAQQRELLNKQPTFSSRRSYPST